jgi:hypothetical protein
MLTLLLAGKPSLPGFSKKKGLQMTITKQRSDELKCK